MYHCIAVSLLACVCCSLTMLMQHIKYVEAGGCGFGEASRLLFAYMVTSIHLCCRADSTVHIVMHASNKRKPLCSVRAKEAQAVTRTTNRMCGSLKCSLLDKLYSLSGVEDACSMLF